MAGSWPNAQTLGGAGKACNGANIPAYYKKIVNYDCKKFNKIGTRSRFGLIFPIPLSSIEILAPSIKVE